MVARAQRQFAGNPHFSLRSVADGLATVGHEYADDETLLSRICAAYSRAEKQTTDPTYDATDWWREVRDAALAPVITSLRKGDIAGLRRQYRNFFRDLCSAGLISRAFGLPNAPANARNPYHLSVYLSDVLFRIEYWKTRIGGPLSQLKGPGIGNPFGLVLDGTLIEDGAEFRHYGAHRVAQLLARKEGTVAEIGGGFGGMAYYLLRDRPGTKYVGFDVPESLALAAWYLRTALPNARITLFGERPLTSETIAASDVLLLPLSELQRLQERAIDIVFSSHAVSDVTPLQAAAYVADIARICRGKFAFIGSVAGGRRLSDLAQRHALELDEMIPSEWGCHFTPGAAFVEGVFRARAR
jgi:hypothetical protein